MTTNFLTAMISGYLIASACLGFGSDFMIVLASRDIASPEKLVSLLSHEQFQQSLLSKRDTQRVEVGSQKSAPHQTMKSDHSTPEARRRARLLSFALHSQQQTRSPSPSYKYPLSVFTAGA